MDFILNDQATGSVAEKLLACNMDAGILRPFLHKGKSYVTLNDGKTYAVKNAVATLTKDDWIKLDTTVVKVARDRLNVVADLNNAGLTYNLPNGMGHTVLQTQTQSDTSDAEISMDGVQKTLQDRPEYELTNLPIPIIHKDFSFTARQIAVSRNGMPLDMTMVEQSARKVGESVEKLALGKISNYKFGGGTIFGLTNFTDRITYTITSPATTGWTPETAYNEFINMIDAAQQKKMYGPFRVYYSPNWMKYMSRKFSTNYAADNLEQEIGKLGKIVGISQADYLTGYEVVLVQMQSDVVRMVNGLPLQTVQWASHGGFKLNFKVLTIQVPQVRSDFDDNCGIVHGSPA